MNCVPLSLRNQSTVQASYVYTCHYGIYHINRHCDYNANGSLDNYINGSHHGYNAIVVLSTAVQDQIEAAVQAALGKVLALTTLSSLAVSGLFLLALVVAVIQYADAMYLSLWTSHFRQRSPGHRPSVVGILLSHFLGHQGRAQEDEKINGMG